MRPGPFPQTASPQSSVPACNNTFGHVQARCLSLVLNQGPRCPAPSCSGAVSHAKAVIQSCEAAALLALLAQGCRLNPATCTSGARSLILVPWPMAAAHGRAPSTRTQAERPRGSRVMWACLQAVLAGEDPGGLPSRHAHPLPAAPCGECLARFAPFCLHQAMLDAEASFPA